MRIYTSKEINEVLGKVKDQGLPGAVQQIESLKKKMGKKRKINEADVPQGAKDILDSYLE